MAEKNIQAFTKLNLLSFTGMKQLLSDRSCTRELCCSPDDNTEQGLPEFVNPRNNVCMRPFCIATDMPFAYDWYRMHYAGTLWQQDGPVNQLRKTYIIMDQSDIAQAYTLLSDGCTLCIAEVYDGTFHEMSIDNNIRRGDYVLQLLFSPVLQGNQPCMNDVLEACLAYCFRHSEVKNIFCELDLRDDALIALLIQHAFQPVKSPDTPGPVRIYKCTAGDFRLL